MELSKQKMELFLLLTELQLRNFFYNMFLTFPNDDKTCFVNRKWNYSNMKRNDCQAQSKLQPPTVVYL